MVFRLDSKGTEHTVSIVGLDEVDPTRGRISWISPVARALIKSREGDSLSFRTPARVETLDVLQVQYLTLD